MKKTIVVIAALALILGAEAFVAFLNMPGSMLEEVTVPDQNSTASTGSNSTTNTTSSSVANPKTGNNTLGQNPAEPNVVIDSPKSGEAVSSPLKISGKIRGGWTFEASFPILIVDWDGKIVGTGHGNVTGDWMTTELVPFEATMTFNRPANVKSGTFSEHGKIIVKKDNPSGISQYDASVEIPIIFK